MIQDSHCATRIILGWIGDAHGSETDMNIEPLALRHQQQLVEGESKLTDQTVSWDPNPSSMLLVRTSPSHYPGSMGLISRDSDLVD